MVTIVITMVIYGHYSYMVAIVITMVIVLTMVIYGLTIVITMVIYGHYSYYYGYLWSL